MENNKSPMRVFSALKFNTLEMVPLVVGGVAAYFVSSNELSLDWKLAAAVATGVATGYGAKVGSFVGKKAAVMLRMRYMIARNHSLSNSRSRTNTPLTATQQNWWLGKINADTSIQNQMRTTLAIMISGAAAGFLAGSIAAFSAANPFMNNFAEAGMHRYEAKRPVSLHTANPTSPTIPKFS